MKSATVYVDRVDGRDTRELALPLALAAIETRVNADNPIATPRCVTSSTRWCNCSTTLNGGHGRGSWWRLKPGLHQRLEGAGHAERDQRIDIDVAKTRVLNMLKQRQKRGQVGLSMPKYGK